MTMSGTRIEWVAQSCQLLSRISEEFRQTQPFAGVTIGSGIHVEPKTVALVSTLVAGGARVVATGNLNSTQASAEDALRAMGVHVVGKATGDPEEHAVYLDEVMSHRPDILLDNGGDLFFRALQIENYDNLMGGTEETTSGRMRLAPLATQLDMPILVINDSPIKQFAENRHSVGQSLFESYIRYTNRSTQGKRVTVFGYGACGKGTAACFRNGFAQVSVVDVDAVTTLEAHFDGFETPSRAEAIASADIIATVTGAEDIITVADLALIKDGAILMNGGHFPQEIATSALRAEAASVTEYPADHITTLTFADGKSIHLLGDGHMANLAGPRPLGNSIESMDIGFALQARCLERVATGSATKADCVVPVPADIDAAVARQYLDLHR